MRSIGRPDRKEYRAAAKAATGEANIFAQRNCKNYFEFQRVWPKFMESISGNKNLQEQLEAAGHLRRRVAWKEMQAENDLEAAKAAMSRDEKRSLVSVDAGETGEIHLNIAD